MELKLTSQDFTMVGTSKEMDFTFRDINTDEDYQHLVDFLIDNMGKSKFKTYIKNRLDLIEAFE